jgi:F-type H+-transporting ATPase subunit b
MVSTILAEVFAFLIILFVLYRYVVPPLKAMTEKRQQEIAQQVEDSQKAKERLEAAETAYREAVENAQNDAARIRDDARADAQRIADEMREKAEEEVERLRRRGEEQLESARSQVVRELRAELGGHSTELASRLVRQELQSDQAKKQSVDSFLDELSRSVSNN